MLTDPNITAVTNGALRGLLESLDADSSYLTPEDYKAYKAGQGRQGAGGDQCFEALWVCDGGFGGAGKSGGQGRAGRRRHYRGDWGQDTRDISLAMIQLLLEGAAGKRR